MLMRFHFASTQTGGGGPWCADIATFLANVSEDLSWDAMVFGILETRRPATDSLWVMDRVPMDQVESWCQTTHTSDPTWKQARRRGVAQVKTAQSRPGPPLPAGLHSHVHLLPASWDGRVVWYLAIGSKKKISPDQMNRASVLLRILCASFEAIAEPGMGRILVDAKHRVVLADPRSLLDLENQPGRRETLEQQLPEVLAQRWPRGLGAGWHDVTLLLEGQAVWLRVRTMGRGRSIELRQASEDDPPAVGEVDDPRVAKALAYLSDRCTDAPSLNDLAQAVDASPFHFHRLFSRYVGVSPKHYLLRMQIQRAKWFLRTSRRSIGEVASQAGFSSHGHFTATFHRVVGTSPTAYRESS